MPCGAGHEVTLLLHAVGQGDEAARGRLLEAVYHELREIAAKQMAREAGPRTLQPTALVHEAYLRLFRASISPSPQPSPVEGEGGKTPSPSQGRGLQERLHPDPLPGVEGVVATAEVGRAPAEPAEAAGLHTLMFENRRHFFAAAAEAMRRILVEGARKKGRKKRGDGRAVLPLPADTPDPSAEAEYDPDELLDVDDALDGLAREHPREAEVVKLRYFAGLSVGDAAQVLGIATRTVEKDWAFARAWLRRTLSGPNDE